MEQRWRERMEMREIEQSTDQALEDLLLAGPQLPFKQRVYEIMKNWKYWVNRRKPDQVSVRFKCRNCGLVEERIFTKTGMLVDPRHEGKPVCESG